jgi:hypothetical protein
MYTLLMVIGIVSSNGAPVGVTSQIIATFENLDECKRVADQPVTGGATSDLNFSRGVYWYCVYSGG